MLIAEKSPDIPTLIAEFATSRVTFRRRGVVLQRLASAKKAVVLSSRKVVPGNASSIRAEAAEKSARR